MSGEKVFGERNDPDEIDNYTHNPIRHTGAFDGADENFDKTSHHAKETALGEDWITTSNVIDGLSNLGIDFLTIHRIMAPRIIAGIKSEREYRRNCHRSLKALGHVAGRHLYNGVMHERDAALMLKEFVDASMAHEQTKVGLELGHIELLNAQISVDQAWNKLDDMAERVIAEAGLEAVDAHGIEPSLRGAIFNGVVKNNGDTTEIKLPRARTNFPVLDIGRTGLQQFVRIAVGYDTVDQSPMSLETLRKVHTKYMGQHTETPGVVKIDDFVAYPLSATLVTLRR